MPFLNSSGSGSMSGESLSLKVKTVDVTGQANGSNLVFTIEPFVAGSISVFVGALQQYPGADGSYLSVNPGAGTFTFSSGNAPAGGITEGVVAHYIKAG
jgi:hypothetical protein